MPSFPEIWGLVKNRSRREAVRQRKQRRAAGFSRALAVENLERRVMLATVNTLIDVNNASDGLITLREAISMTPAGGTVDFNPAAIGVNGGVIVLDRITLGAISFGKNLTIDASMLSSGITIDANDPTPVSLGDGIRIFDVTDSTAGVSPPLVTVNGLRLIGGDSELDGGAIRSAARLRIINCTFEGNNARKGGGVFVQVAGGGATSREVLKIENSQFADNFAADFGGGVAIVAGNYVNSTSNHYVSDTVVINNTIFRENTATNFGGGIYAQLFGGKLDIGNSTKFESNQAGSGGGFYFEIGGNSAQSRLATMNVIDTTFTANSANGEFDSVLQPLGVGGAIGGRIFKDAAVNIVDSKISGNEAFQGGGISVDFGRPINIDLAGYHSQSPKASLTISRTVVDDNVAESRGGGIFTKIGAGGQVTIEQSTVSSCAEPAPEGCRRTVCTGAVGRPRIWR